MTFPFGKRVFIRLLVVLMLLATAEVAGQGLSRPAEGYSNTVGAAVSGGAFFDKEATFWGASVDYSRVFLGDWIFNVSFSYDQEHRDSEGGSRSITNTLSPSVALGYAISSRFAAGVGLGKGLFDDGNSEKEMKYNPKGSWTIGLLGVYTFYQANHHSFDVSFGIEKGLGVAETDMTIELGYGYSF